MSEKRRDNRNRILREGEYQRKDGRYRFRYIDEDGKEKNVYSWRLDKNDPMPKGKKREPSLREKEKQIEADLFDRIVTNGGNYTVLELVEKYVSLKTGVRHNTVRLYGDTILKWISQARVAPRYEHLTIPYDYFSHQRTMQGNFDHLKKVVGERIVGSNICPQVLLRKQLLNDYFRAKALGEVPLLQQSWRLDLLGPLDVPLEPMQHESEESSEEILIKPPFLT